MSLDWLTLQVPHQPGLQTEQLTRQFEDLRQFGKSLLDLFAQFGIAQVIGVQLFAIITTDPIAQVRVQRIVEQNTWVNGL